ncbi:hypothetical protein AX16_002096 [Volvariella volvacea WC 439]|nr:hypothetical protein AX16_002096 [Volvariella volvacea WC 439]
MKIIHKSKRPVPPHPQVAELITKLVNTPDDDLAEVLSQIDSWKWPRSDLNAWTKVLNKMDAVLETAIKDYDVDKIQINDFTPHAKRTICEILRFERLLLENSTNRKMFSSYDRLNSLLYTADLDVLILALNLLLRPSQQYSAQPSVTHALSISTPRLQSLAKRWPQSREHGVGLVDLVTEKGGSEVEALPGEARQVNFTFYRTETESKVGAEKKVDVDAPDTVLSTPRKQSTTTQTGVAGAVNIHIDEHTVASQSVMQVLANTMEAYAVPESEKFELLCRIRAAKVLSQASQSDREKLVIVRLLAVAIFGHTHQEHQAASSIFLFEPDLISHIAELLQVDKGIPVAVQTVALAALDALARYRSRLQEVLAAVNAGVNHGLLMGLFRKTIADIANPSSTLPHAFVEALLQFVTFIASHPSGGNMIVGAGLIPLLIQVIENKLPGRLQLVSKAMQLVDNVLYSFSNAFNLFCNSRGVETLVERIEHEIDYDIQEYGTIIKPFEVSNTFNDVPVARAAVLKHTLRSMNRMMGSSGTAEGLRGLIDMSLLKSIKKIIEYRGLFGPSILPIAINIMATFVHNEPTSLAIIQEAALPEHFYKMIEYGLEPAIEVIQAIPNAIGALCLNEQGQAQLTNRPSIIPSIFSIFTSEKHLKVLLDKEHAVLIGTAIDELIRHHPSLKMAVFESIKTTLSKIEDLGYSFTVPENLRKWYRLTPVPPSPKEKAEDATMEGVETTSASTSTGSSAAPQREPENEEEDDSFVKSHDNVIVSYIDIIGRFLEGLFQHMPHCRDFITATDGLVRLGRLTCLPCLPYDYANSVASDSMVQVMRTMTEVATNETLLHMTRLVKESLAATQDFWSTPEENSKLLPFVDISSGQEEQANQQFRELITLHIRITLLSDVFATAGYAHGRGAIGLLQTLMSNTSSEVINDLGRLHRMGVWENIVLSIGLNSKGIEVQSSPSDSPLGASSQQDLALPDVGGHPVATNGEDENLGTTSVTSATPGANQPAPQASDMHWEDLLLSTSQKQFRTGSVGPRDDNAAALKHLTHGLPAALAPFFQAMVKMFNARRSLDASQRKQIAETSGVFAEIMVQHLKFDINNVAPLYTYYSVMLGFFTLLLVDERTTSQTLHTIQLNALYKAGGLDALIDVCHKFMASIAPIMQIRAEDRTDAQKKDMLHAFGGLKVALHLIHPLISGKPLFDSQQTQVLVTRDKKDTDPNYFEPHNFLVKLRLKALPLIRELWEVSWLHSAPLSVIKVVIQTVLELTGGENEEVKADTVAEASAPSGTWRQRPTGPDEGRISALVEMGFPRSAVERALVRTHNNINAATELLLANPFPLPPDPPTAPAAVAAEDQPQTGGDAEDGGDDQEDSEGIPAESETPEAPSESETAVGKSHEELRKELDEGREQLRLQLSQRSIKLIDEHQSLLFDLHSTFLKPNQEAELAKLIDDIKTFSPAAQDIQMQPLANRCRLLALILNESPSAINSERRVRLLNYLLALLLSVPINVDTTLPTWLAAHLLLTETLFTLSEEPRQITLPKEGEPVVAEALTEGPSLTESRKLVFDFCLKLLALPQLPADDMVSILRLFVLLTREHQYAVQFVKRDGLNLLFTRIKVSPVPNTSSYLALILRHTMEDGATLQHIMRTAIKHYLNQSRTRLIEASTYVKHCNGMVFRDPQAFIEATKSLCKLGQPFSTSPHISLKQEPTNNNDVKEEKEGKEGKEGKTDDMQVDQQAVPSTFSATNETLEAVVHFLVNELMAVSKQINQHGASGPTEGDNQDAKRGTPTVSTAPATSAASSAPPTSTDSETPQSLADLHSYACLLMQCLAELLFSYDACKTAFLSYSTKRRTQTPAKETPLKHRSATLNFLLSDFVYFPNIVPPPNGKPRDRYSLCNWAMSVIVAVCVDSSSIPEGKDVSPELVSIRKFVLETVSRAIKDLTPIENPEASYGRLYALADLCHRLLTVRFNNLSRRTPDETPTHIGKIMLEKNFVSTLTNALAEVDLNYPNVRGLVTSILRPLEYLTKIAIKMSRASKGKDVTESIKTESEASMDSDVEDEDMDEEEGREETPDLYRNSALGMYAGEMDDNFAGEDEMDEDEEDEDGDVEMGYDEDTGSEDTSHTEEEEEEDELGAEDDQEEDWEDVDEEEEEDLVENEDEEGADEEPDEGQEDEEDADEEVDEEVWQNMAAGDAGDVAEEVDDGDRGTHPVHMLPMEDEEPEMMSEGEEYILDNAVEAEEVFGYDAYINRGDTLLVPRRHRGSDDVQLFGRTRNGPAPPREATTHPLLLDASAAAPGPPTIPSRSSRTPHRILANPDINQTIEDLIGGGALHFFQQFMTRQGLLPGAEIHLDVPSGALINFDRGLFQSRRGGPLYSASLRVERAPRPSSDHSTSRDLEPILTLQRWAEEVKVLQGEFATERGGKLVNHVALALLPEAIETKLREEKEAAEKQEKEAAAAAAAEAEAQAAEAAKEGQEPQKIVEQPPSGEEQPTLETTQNQADSATIQTSATDVDTNMADATAIPQAAETSEGNAASSEAQPVPAQAEGSTSRERITVLIHGSPVDITDTGIDPTFLEALPEDMREEVLNQHVRDQQAARVERPADSQISSEFLDALPPDIRAEIIQQEAIDRERRRREEAPPAQAPAEIDPASFIASLDPSLRQAVLMEQDDGFIQTLPSHMIAEASAYRARWRTRVPPAVPIPAPTKKPTPQHDAIQLLDKNGIAILLRLLFYPQVVRKTLFKVLGNLCENAKTRTELFNLLLNILQDGTGDLAAVDKSFAQMSVKNNKPQTPKSAGKQKVEKLDLVPILPVPVPQGEALPEFIAQRCLEAMSHIVGANELSSLFFLTEHEVPTGLRKIVSRKGKGKERQAQTHYPIVLLMGLLDRQTLLRTPAIMESVVGLLATVTRPLSSLKDGKPAEVPKEAEPARSDNAPPDTTPVTSNTVPTTSNTAPTAPNATPADSTENAEAPPKVETTTPPDEKMLLPNPPQIPHGVLRLIVNILTVGECSGRTFQQSLTLIQNLSHIPDARDVIAQELKTKAQEFGQVLYGDLDRLAVALQSPIGDAFVSSVASSFSPASSTQAKLLRVLKTIDYMYSAKGEKSASPGPAESEDAEKVQTIYESFRFTPLWRRLGDCLSIIEEKPDLEHIATVLLPLIEALMVVCKYVGTKTGSAARVLRASASPRSPVTPRESMEDLFVSFTDAHRKILNLMVRNNPSLMSGSFSLLVHNPRVLDFDNKRNYFNQQLHRRPPGTREHHSTIQLNVRRARVFEDSFQHLQRKTGDQIKYGKLSVRFYDEEGVDAGGVTREWFQILARQMFDPNNALFQPCAADKLTYQPNKNSWVNPEHLSFFKFVGRVIGKAIYDGRLLDAYFARSLYRQLLGKPVDYKDVEWVDPEYYNSLCWILENDPTALDLTFSVEADEFGVSRIVPLKPGGESIPVTQENRREFVQLSAQYRLHSSIKDQIENLLAGFYEIIPKELITIFNEQELELLISGTPDIDVDEWRAATEYNGYTSSDPNIVWWWRALKSFNRDERAKVLSFATGTSKVPLGGFTELQGVQGVQRFSIHRAYGEADRLPQAHTCFNQIDLPQYSSYEMLRQQLLLAINEGGEGFAFS